jgi:hypothetical protein
LNLRTLCGGFTQKTIPDSVVRSKRTFRTLFPAAKPVPTEQL